MFVAKKEKRAANLLQAASLTAGPAVLIAPDDAREPAVVLRSQGQIHGVLPLNEALRVATQMADVIAAHRKATP